MKKTDEIPEQQPISQPTAQVVHLQELPAQTATGPRLLDGNLSLISGVKVRLEVAVGGADISVAELFDLRNGSVIPLDQLKDAPLVIRLDGQVIAHGILVVVGDNFGVRISDVLPSTGQHAN